jgi:hypothetical protein
MEKHTPGPWKVASLTEATDGYLYRNIESGTGKRVARVLARRDSDQEEKANASLIARAPDLLAEVERLTEVNKDLADALVCAENELVYLFTHGMFSGTTQSMLAIIRAALKRAGR